MLRTPILRWVVIGATASIMAACTASHGSDGIAVPVPDGDPLVGEWVLDHGPGSSVTDRALARVSPQLRAAYIEAREFGAISAPLRTQLNAWSDPRDGRLMVDVIVHGDANKPDARLQAEALGMSVGLDQAATGLLFGSIPMDQVGTIAAAPAVDFVEVSRPMNRMLDTSIEANGGSPVSMNLTRDSDADGTDDQTGAGAVVGVVDTGIDYTHEDFRDPVTGLSRIRYIWDQTDCGDANPPADVDGGPAASFGCNDGNPCGSEYTMQDINCELAATGLLSGDVASALDCTGTRRVGQRDVDGHGTHVTSTAAGNGGLSDHVGVAPEADIIVVKFDFDQECDRNSANSIINGIRYAFQRAGNDPAAINLSLGTTLGPHTGHTGEERGIDALSGAGRVVVVAAGNAARNMHPANLSVFGYPIHGRGTVEQGTTTSFSFEIPSGYTVAPAGENYVVFDVWYGQDVSAAVEVTVHAPGARPFTVRAGQDKCSRRGGGGRVCILTSNDPYWELDNTDHELWIQIDDGLGFAPAAGTYTVEITGTSIPAGGLRYDAWMVSSRNLGLVEPSFPEIAALGGAGSDNDRTVGSPGTANDVITVAAYTTRDTWTDMNGVTQGYGLAGSQTEYYGPMPVDDLAFFSSRGDTRDGRLKPEIAAPGAGIIAAFSHWAFEAEEAAFLAEESPYFYPGRITDAGAGGYNARAVLQGTSMATPHATGGVALLLARNPSMTPADVRLALESSANLPAGGSANDWGYGRFDLDASFVVVDVVAISCLNDAACSDGTFCNGAEVCTTDHECVAGSVPSCDDGDACTFDSCDAEADVCDNMLDPMCEPPPPPPSGDCGNGTCDADESCDGRSGTTACIDDCPGKLNGRPSGRWCTVGGTCEGSGC